MRGKSEGYLSTTGVDGVARLYRFTTHAGSGWRVVAGIPEAVVFAQYNERLRRNLAIGFGVLLLMLLSGWRLSMAIVRPIGALAAAAAKTADGDTMARAALVGQGHGTGSRCGGSGFQGQWCRGVLQCGVATGGSAGRMRARGRAADGVTLRINARQRRARRRRHTEGADAHTCARMYLHRYTWR